MRQAFVLVGGKGTRLGPLARDTPKPLLPVAGGRRFLDYILVHLARQGVRDIVLLAGHLGAMTHQIYHGTRVLNASVRVVVEKSPAGTAGALLGAGCLDEVFLLVNGDSFADVNILALADTLKPRDVASIALRSVSNAERYGQVDVDGDRILRFREKDGAGAGDALISCGAYALRRSIMDWIHTAPLSLESNVFPKLADAKVLAGMCCNGFFIDIGLPETLSEARATFPDRMRRPAVLFDRDGTLIEDSGYTHRLEDLAWQPRAIETIRAVNDAGALAIVVTNQSGVARGLYSEGDMHRFHEHMQAELRRRGAHIDAFYHCPYHGDGTIAGFSHANHPDRKPNPGMLRRALLEWEVAPDRCLMVGDTPLDTGAADAAGLKSVQVAPGQLMDAVTERLPQMMPPGNDLARVVRALKSRSETAKTWLFAHALPLWWSQGFDRSSHCFHERLRLDGAPDAALPRRARVQARQTFVYARAGRMGWDGPWQEALEAGVETLLKRCIRSDGGTRHLLAPNGDAADNRRDLYDLAFVSFALAEAALARDHDQTLIAEAQRLVGWAENAWADAFGGFQEGDISPTPPRRQNPHMHMLEAMLALHDATGADDDLKRADRIATLFEERFFDAKHGALPEYYEEDWRPRSGEQGLIVEPGHHFEWSWLLHRWGDKRGDRMRDQAERLRIHAEVYGVNARNGAVYDELYVDGRARTRTSRLWPHTERLKANVVRFERARDINAADCAVQAFDTLQRYLDMPRVGLWRDRMNEDGSFVEEAAPASSLYHIALALSELIRVADSLELP